MTHLYTNWPNFWQNFEKNCLIFPKFSFLFKSSANCGSNLGKLWKMNPFVYQILHFIRGHSYTKRLILLPMLAACACKVFCTETPSGHYIQWHPISWCGKKSDVRVKPACSYKYSGYGLFSLRLIGSARFGATFNLVTRVGLLGYLEHWKMIFFELKV